MIVKFDHIAYACSISQEYDAQKLFGDYEIQFHEVGLENLHTKRAFMRSAQGGHNIMLLHKNGCYPIEITAYAKCELTNLKREAKYKLEKDRICINSKQPKATEAFFEILGMKKNEDSVLELKPFLDDKPLRIQVVRFEEDEDVYLDEEGFVALAFVVDNINRQKQLMEKNDIFCTDIEELCVNGNKLKIFFAKSATGEIIEFIGLR